MWNMPSMGGMPPPADLTTPLCQNPPRSVWLLTVPVVLPPGPNGLGLAVPDHVQLPSKNLSCATSAGGFGASMAVFFSAAAAGLAAGFSAFFSAFFSVFFSSGFPPICAYVHGTAARQTAATAPIMERVVIR